MDMLRCKLGIFCLLAFIGAGIAVRSGEEIFESTKGKFYLFSDKQVTVVDPVGVTVLVTITADHQGLGFVDSAGSPFIWGDTVYMEDATAKKYHVFANAYSATKQTESFVYVFDTSTNKVVSKVQVGPRPVHIYAIPELQAVWTHSDGLGAFDVITIDDVSKLKASQVKALENTPGHGKLIVDPDLFPRAFATNVAERYVFEVDLVTHTNKASYPYTDVISNSSLCIGTHAIAYTKLNKHIYLECVAGGGTLEWNTKTNKLVKQHSAISGHLTLSRDESFVLVTEKLLGRATLLKPGANGEASTILAQVNLTGKPGYPAFFPRGGISSKNVQDYKLYFPTTVSTNKELLARVSTLTTLGLPTYDSAPTDCIYNGTGANGFKTVAAKDCGSCVSTAKSTNPQDWAYTTAGVQWVDLADVAAGRPLQVSFLSSGAVIPTVAGSAANQCSFGLTYRSAVRGLYMVLVPADLPAPSVYVISGDDAKVQGVFNVTEHPKPPQYVPANSMCAYVPSTLQLGVLAVLLLLL